MKQTEMLSRELGITDSLTRDTLYRVHLRYVKMRQISNTRAEDLERMQAFYAELKQILTPQQYEQFMHQQMFPGPRQQRDRVPNDAMGNRPMPNRVLLPQDHPRCRRDSVRPSTSDYSN